MSNRALVGIDGSSACSLLIDKIPGIEGFTLYRTAGNAVVFCVDEKSQIKAVRRSEAAIAGITHLKRAWPLK